MLSTLLTTSLALLSTTSALTLPPNLPPAVEAAALNPPPASSPEGPTRFGQPKASIELACPNCPLAVGTIHGHPHRWEQGPDTRLLIDLTSDGSQLYFNGAPIYPLSPKSMGRRLTAKQVYADENDATSKPELYTRGLALSTGIEIHPQVEMISFHLDASNIQDVVERVPMRSLSVTVMGLGDQLVRVDTIRVKFSDDSLEIHDVAILPYGSDVSAAEAACSTVLCRLRASLKSKLQALHAKIQAQVHGSANKQACATSAAAGIKGSPEVIKGADKFAGKFSHAFPGFKGHSHAHNNSAWHKTVRVVASFVNHILIPVLIGIAAGMLVSGIGMLFGQLAIWAYHGCFGRSLQSGGYEIVFVDEEDADEEEALPRYEEVGTPLESGPPPAFEEKAVLQ